MSKIYLAAWMESVTTIIFEILSINEAWLIPHLIANNSASVLVTNAEWWHVLDKGLFGMCVYKMAVAMLFLMLASVTVMAIDVIDDDLITIESSWWRQFLSFFPLLLRLKENWLEKVSMILKPGENSGWRGDDEETAPYDLLFASMRWPLIFVFCCSIKHLREDGWWCLSEPNGESMRDQIMWLEGRDIARSWDLPPSFVMCNLMGIRPVSASMSSVREVLKVPKIQMATLLCILLKTLKGYNKGAWL